MNKTNLSISTAAYDGYDLEIALASIKQLGINNIELAYIDGALANFSEELFSAVHAKDVKAMLDQYELACTSLACHTNLKGEDAGEKLLRRVEFAITIGCPRIITYATNKVGFATFLERTQEAATVAKQNGIKILIENPGDQKAHIIEKGKDLEDYHKLVDGDVWGFNYDPGNLFSQKPGIDLLYDALRSIRTAEHIHFKDVLVRDCGFHLAPIGKGLCRYDEFVEQFADSVIRTPASIELPMRLSRDKFGQPSVAAEKLSVGKIEDILKESIDCINHHLVTSKLRTEAII